MAYLLRDLPETIPVVNQNQQSKPMRPQSKTHADHSAKPARNAAHLSSTALLMPTPRLAQLCSKTLKP
eukprot:12257241-Prorocentrum_lima.AAC.1